MTAVKAAPARIPNRGLEKVDMIRIKGSESRNGDMEELIMPIPINNTPNPARIWPMGRAPMVWISSFWASSGWPER